MKLPSIDAARLQASLQELGRVGAYTDERTGLVGVNRLALSDADKRGRDLVVGWFKDAGLQVSVDRIGNAYARRAGKNPSLAPVLSGSHIDSVPTAGMFDGCLGVLGALEVVRTLDAAGIATERPIDIAFFTEEEGCRFGTDMLGSAVATGRIALEDAYKHADRDGKSVRGELEAIGYLGDEEPATREPHAYVECHIEQGPVLRSKGLDVGVVTGVQAISWQELSITGKSAHAGTTPNRFRNDAGLAAAKINVRLQDMVRSGDFGDAMLATMGVMQPHPGMINVVPGRVKTTVDLRNPEDALMAKQEAALKAYFAEVEKECGVSIEAKQTAKTPRIRFSEDVMKVIEAGAAELGLKHERILSGAGHDAQEWSARCKTAMIFVPGEYDGISHNPREFSSPEQCADGVNLQLRTIVALANEV